MISLDRQEKDDGMYIQTSTHENLTVINNGTDQPLHLHSLVYTFAILSLENIIAKHATRII